MIAAVDIQRLQRNVRVRLWWARHGGKVWAMVYGAAVVTLIAWGMR